MNVTEKNLKSCTSVKISIKAIRTRTEKEAFLTQIVRQSQKEEKKLLNIHDSIEYIECLCLLHRFKLCIVHYIYYASWQLAFIS